MRPVRLRLFFALACAVCAVANAQPQPERRTAVRVVAFAGGCNLPLWAAQRRGFFERRGIAVELS